MNWRCWFGHDWTFKYYIIRRCGRCGKVQYYRDIHDYGGWA